MVTKKETADVNAGPEMSFDERVAFATAPAWRPETGDKLENVEVVKVRIGDGDYGQYPIVVYKKADGSYVAFHAFHQIARERLAELKTTRGSRHNLVYLGRKTGNAVKSDGTTTEYELYYIEDANAVTVDGGVDDDFKF